MDNIIFDTLYQFALYMEEKHNDDINIRSPLIRALRYIYPTNGDVRLLEDRFIKIYPSKRWYAANPCNVVNLKYLMQTLENIVLCEDFKVENLNAFLNTCYEQYFSKSKNPKRFEDRICQIKVRKGVAPRKKDVEDEGKKYVPFNKVLPRLIRETGYSESAITRKVRKLSCYRKNHSVKGGEIEKDKIEALILYLQRRKEEGKMNRKALGFTPYMKK